MLATVDKCRERLRLLEVNGFDGDDLDLQPIIQKLLSASQQESASDMKSEPIEVTPDLPIGEILLRQGQVTSQDLESALMAQAAGDLAMLARSWFRRVSPRVTTSWRL